MANNEHDAHAHYQVLGKKTELYFAVFCGVFLVIGFSIEKLIGLEGWFSLLSYIISYFFGGFFITIEAIKKIPKGEFDIDFLMIAAAAGAAYIGSWAEGALLLFLFSLGHALEHYAMNKAKKSIEALGHLSPKTALIKRNGKLEEVPIETLKIEDVIVVKPNTKIAADGVILRGSSSINQAPITGESMPIDKTSIASTNNLPEFKDINKNHVVFAGTINGDSSIEVLVLKLTEDSTVSRLIKMVSEVETQKSPTQRLTKKFEKWYVPIVIIVVFILCFAFIIVDETFNASLYRAITVLVAASPCALAISTPSAVLSGIARAAQKGVLIKGGKALEDLGEITTIAFDKTGTLTEGKPKLTNLIPLNNFNEKDLAHLVLEVESLSNHPLAKAIANDLSVKFNIASQNKASNVNAIQGKGIQAQYKGEKTRIGNVKLMEDSGLKVTKTIHAKMNQLLQNGHTVMLVAFKTDIVGLVSVMDLPRKTAASTLKRLQEIGVKHMIMLTGDHQNVGDAIAKQIGLTEAKGNLLPEDKVSAIKALIKRDKKIAMVGDGVNDAPAMALSTVSIAMGAAGSDVALETADVALMSDKIENLPFVIGLSRASKRIIKQNIFISLGVVVLLVPVTILGLTNIGVAVAFHEGSTIVVVLNALRLLRFKMS
ncbi:heavy metal translocating P-type ATPase [Algibacter amylolyticus]|uniref:P-type Zn(2+) transporter n=1 Tax=Algibacter amylolyticus TaxID=1608400 RepID=A0A5M7BC09_9FLAO|nr:heavy metal translocating P-type ATPase [Algibacter amylolyticus]KAA5826230.1 heavy metal translocating P-type ATPase [Algibacter amylolyticus]MBB5268432.1 Cd2+/Zn2+-exporting ATPase [Algibacter amylolyticus]TSJ80268.1 heavy metal translocating P-type ATPase [Algibacter amylolyticus]